MRTNIFSTGVLFKLRSTLDGDKSVVVIPTLEGALKLFRLSFNIFAVALPVARWRLHLAITIYIQFLMGSTFSVCEKSVASAIYDSS